MPGIAGEFIGFFSKKTHSYSFIITLSSRFNKSCFMSTLMRVKVGKEITSDFDELKLVEKSKILVYISMHYAKF
ncbi:MAG: hypothetical protein Ct9H300mP28_04280 [Pseudomonadota bacterium]|nr:MAG: hypothetical protein Ct9H300mP28_04280 [Pseudomonadota bacterium]